MLEPETRPSGYINPVCEIALSRLPADMVEYLEILGGCPAPMVEEYPEPETLKLALMSEAFMARNGRVVN